MTWDSSLSSEAGPYKVLMKRGVFTDAARGDREIPFKFYAPVDHDLDRYPLILWSHGFGGNADGAGFISRYLASYGYAIAHLTHRGTDSSLWEGKPGHPWDILRQVKIPREMTFDRMRDVPFFLNQLPDWVAEQPEFAPFVDFSRVGMSGHSFGAMTTQVMAGMPLPDREGNLIDMRDERFRAGILYSPVPIAHLSQLPPAELYGRMAIPLFHMTGTDDASPLEPVGYEHRLVVHEHAGHPEQYLKILQDGDHMVYNGTRGKLSANPKREEHEQLIKIASLAFWDAYLKDDARAKAWLADMYAIRAR
ncbi:MAG: hypothetical protein H6858_05390 [Rhodospirillales bacterium]|nr:hypothetical protein [Rhodospirillales bacterium]